MHTALLHELDDSRMLSKFNEMMTNDIIFGRQSHSEVQSHQSDDRLRIQSYLFLVVMLETGAELKLCYMGVETH